MLVALFVILRQFVVSFGILDTPSLIFVAVGAILDAPVPIFHSLGTILEALGVTLSRTLADIVGFGLHL